MDRYDRYLVVMGVGIVLALISPLPAVLLTDDGTGLDAFFIALIPFSIGASLVCYSLLQIDRVPTSHSQISGRINHG